MQFQRSPRKSSPIPSIQNPAPNEIPLQPNQKRKPKQTLPITPFSRGPYSLDLAEYGTQAHNDTGEGGLDVLIRIGDELLDKRQYVGHDDGLLVERIEILAEVADLVGGGGSHLGLRVLEEDLEGGDQVGARDLLADGLLQVGELVGHHVADAPGLVCGALAQGRHDQLLDVLLLEERGDGDAGLDCQQAHRVLCNGKGSCVWSFGRMTSKCFCWALLDRNAVVACELFDNFKTMEVLE